MKLNEILQTYNCNLKIGAKSGFFWCGVPNEDTIDQLTYFSISYKRRIKRFIKDLQSYLDLNRFNTFWNVELKNRIHLLLEEKQKASREEMEAIRLEWEKDKEKSRNQAEQKLNMYENFIANWCVLPEREVKEVYDSIDDLEEKGIKIIIVEGLENGDYWTSNEFKKKYKE